jgi:DNA-binding MarR family transcriptional regulator
LDVRAAQAELIAEIERLRGRLQTAEPPIAWSEIELTIPQYRALNLLMSGPRRMTEIAARLGTSLQATTSLADRLVEKGLVTREHDTVDRRVVFCRLSPRGLEEVERFHRIGQARLELLVEVLDETELPIALAAFQMLTNAAARLRPSGNEE